MGGPAHLPDETGAEAAFIEAWVDAVADKRWRESAVQFHDRPYLEVASMLAWLCRYRVTLDQLQRWLGEMDQFQGLEVRSANGGLTCHVTHRETGEVVEVLPAYIAVGLCQALRPEGWPDEPSDGEEKVAAITAALADLEERLGDTVV